MVFREKDLLLLLSYGIICEIARSSLVETEGREDDYHSQTTIRLLTKETNLRWRRIEYSRGLLILSKWTLITFHFDRPLTTWTRNYTSLLKFVLPAK